MAFQNPSRPAAIAEMNITPLVDVMLVLLIIFMVATPMLTRSLAIDLPVGPPPPIPPGAEPDPVTVSIDAAGRIAWNGQVLPLRAVEAMLQIEAVRARQPLLKIQVDDEADYRHVATVLGQAQHAGMTRIAMPY